MKFSRFTSSDSSTSPYVIIPRRGRLVAVRSGSRGGSAMWMGLQAAIFLLFASNSLFAIDLSAPVLNPTNGHFYARVSTADLPEDQRGWPLARAEAESLSHQGLRGYLATITSADEEFFLATRFGTRSGRLWLGGSDQAEEGVWKWETGPEAGTVFWTSLDSVDAYSNWCPIEPNDVQWTERGEDYLLWNWGPGTCWNDMPENRNDLLHGYLVEFSAVIPEPSTYTLGVLSVILGLSCLIKRRMRIRLPAEPGGGATRTRPGTSRFKLSA